MPQIINGKEISTQIKDELKQKVSELKEKGICLCLAVIQVGNDPASSVYVGNKKKACEYIGIESLSYELSEDVTQKELISLVESLNEREDVNGILVQLPLPEHIDDNSCNSAGKGCGWFSSSECRRALYRTKGICILHTRRYHTAVKTFRC